MAVTPGKASRQSANTVILWARSGGSMEVADTPCHGHRVGIFRCVRTVAHTLCFAVSPTTTSRAGAVPPLDPRRMEAAMARTGSRIRIAFTLLALATPMAFPGTSIARSGDDFADVRREIATRHDEAVKRLQE